jgi:hypothetical protein
MAMFKFLRLCLLITGSLSVMPVGFAAASAERNPACRLPGHKSVEIKNTLPQHVLRERKQLVRQFIVFSYRHLASDLLSGEGFYLTSLYQLYAKNAWNESEFTALARCLLLKTEPIPDFARELSEHY